MTRWTRLLKPSMLALLLIPGGPLTGLSTSGALAPPPGDEAWDNRFYGGLGTTEFLQELRDGSVLAVGRFNAGGATGVDGNVIRWRPTAGWEPVGGGLNGQLRAAAEFQGSLYVAGSGLTSADGLPVRNLVRQRDGQWMDVAGGVEGIPFAMLVHGDRLYVGGELTSAGGVPVANLAGWDGNAWTALGSGLPFRVRSLAVYRGELIAAGGAATAKAQGGIWRWDGQSWHPLGTGVSSTLTTASIQTLVAVGTNLYAGGAFSQAGGEAAKNVARWDGQNWHALGSGPVGAGVTGLRWRDPELIAGSAGLSVWDGTTWQDYPGNRLTSVYTLALAGTEVMAAGFSMDPVAGGSRTVALSRGDDYVLQGLGSRSLGVPEVNAFAAGTRGVFVGGALRPDQVSRWECLSHWDGFSWRSLNGGLLVGGVFDQAGRKTSLGFGLWQGPATELELDLRAPQRVAPAAVFEVQLEVRRVAGTLARSAVVRLPLPEGVQLVAADAAGTEVGGAVTWSRDVGVETGTNLLFTCQLRAPASEGLLLFREAVVETPDQTPFRARLFSTAVRAERVAPTVRLITPAAGPVVVRGAILLEAEVEAGAGAVQRVEFHAGDRLVATAPAAPWRATWTNAVSGTSRFRAVLVEATGQRTFSLPVSVELRDPPPNDAFADRVPLPVYGTTMSVDPLGATAEPGEPPPWNNVPAEHSLWWSFTPPADGRLLLTIPFEGIRLRLYSGTELPALVPQTPAFPEGDLRVLAGVGYPLVADYPDDLPSNHWNYRYLPDGGRFVSATLLSDGNLVLNFEGLPGAAFTLEGSTNLVDWAEMFPFMGSPGAQPLLVPLSPETPRRFFRVR